MIIGRSLTPLNSSRTLRAVRRRETVPRSGDNSRRKLQNVRGGSSANNIVDSLLPTASTDDIEFTNAVRAIRLFDAEATAKILDGYVRQNPADTFVWTAAARHFGAGAVFNGRLRFLELCENVHSGNGAAEPRDIVAARQAFALHEVGRLKEAETLASNALTAEPSNGSAVHSLLHVFYDAARHRDGLALATNWLSTAGTDNPMRSHFGWHAATHALALKDCNEARRLFDISVLDHPTTRSITVDGPALMWRIHLRGDTAESYNANVWQALKRLHFHTLTPLSAACVAFGFAALRDRGRLCELVQDLDERMDERFTVASTVAHGLVAWLDEDWRAAEKCLRIARRGRWRLGGSRIQQEIVDWTWRAAAARCKSWESHFDHYSKP